MKKRKRITKKELKQDEFVTLTSEVITYIIAHQKRFLIGLAFVVVIILGVATGIILQNRYNNKAAEVFSLGWNCYHPQQQSDPNAQPITPDYVKAGEYFQKGYTDYARSPIAPQAMYYHGLTQLKQNSAAEAIQTFENFLNTFPENILVSEVSMLLATCYQGQGDVPQTIEYLDQSSERFDKPIIKSFFLLQKGIYLQKIEKLQEARIAFQTLIDDYPDSPWSKEAQDYILLLPEAPEPVELPSEESAPLPAEPNGPVEGTANKQSESEPTAPSITQEKTE